MNENNGVMAASDHRLQYFEGIIPPTEWMIILDGTMHRYDPDQSMRLTAKTYKMLLDLTRRKNLCVVFVGSNLDAQHALKQLKSIGQDEFPWIACIDEHTNAVAYLAFAKCVIANQTPLAQVAVEHNVPTIQLEVDPHIPTKSLSDSHSFLRVDEHQRVEDWINQFV